MILLIVWKLIHISHNFDKGALSINNEQSTHCRLHEFENKMSL
jgi:hypothetical protein